MNTASVISVRFICKCKNEAEINSFGYNMQGHAISTEHVFFFFLLQNYEKQTEHNMPQLFSMLINFNFFIL